MAKKIIHVNQHVIRANRKNGANDAPITIKCRKQNVRAYGVEICGPSRLIYSPDKPLSCGARMWLETAGEVVAVTDDGGLVLR